jgi:hypothetical protein
MTSPRLKLTKTDILTFVKNATVKLTGFTEPKTLTSITAISVKFAVNLMVF